MTGTRTRVRLVARMPQSGRGRQGGTAFFLFSLAVHLGFVAAILLWPTSGSRARIDPDAIAVTLTGGLARPETRVRQAAPPPEPEPSPEPAAPPEGASLEPKQIKITDRKPPAEKEKKPEIKQPPRQPDENSSGSGADGPSGSGPAADVGMVGNPFASLDLDNVEYAWYSSSVTASLRGNWIRPPLVNVHDSLSVIVAFEIQRNGLVRNIRIESSSGVRSLDRSALRAVTDASPLPPLPSSLGKASLPARFEFRWYPGRE